MQTTPETIVPGVVSNSSISVGLFLDRDDDTFHDGILCEHEY
jgi:hypothetical protein